MLPEALRPATAKASAARAKAKEEGGGPDDPGELRKAKRTVELAAIADVLPAEERAAEEILAVLVLVLARPGWARTRRQACDGAEGAGQHPVGVGEEARRQGDRGRVRRGAPPRPAARAAVDRRDRPKRPPDRDRTQARGGVPRSRS